MTTAQPTATEPAYRAFAAAVAARDLEALVDTLAPEAVAYSAVISAPFEGRDVLADLYEGLFEAFEELQVTDEFQNGDTYAFFWEGRIDGRFVAGADRLRFDSNGKVREITIVGRPLTGLSTFITGIGYQFARRRRGPVVARILRLTALPLAPLFSLLDPVSAWLMRGRRGRS